MQYHTPSVSTDSISSFTKKPLKWVEHPLKQFNEVTIPQRVDLLQKHKSNIQRFLQCGDFKKANQEQGNAAILLRQLKRDLKDIEDLRNQVQDKDLVKFDLMTKDSRYNAGHVIKEYLLLREHEVLDFADIKPGNDQIGNTQHGSPKTDLRQRLHHDRIDQVPFESPAGVQQHQLQSPTPENLEDLENYLCAFESLQEDLVDLHDISKMLATLSELQGEKVTSVEDNVEKTQHSVEEGAHSLAKAARYKTAMYPLTFALVGTCIGGPVGLVAGLKLGGLTAAGCGALGYLSGYFIKKKQEKRSDETLAEMKDMQPMKRKEKDT